MTKRAILRAGLWALAVVVLFIGVLGVFALCLRHKFNPAEAVIVEAQDGEKGQGWPSIAIPLGPL